MLSAKLPGFMNGPERRKSAAACLVLLALNASVCWPLFTTEYLNDLQSNEGIFITIGKFLRDYWPQVGWFPWFAAGAPIENVYFALLPILVALGAWMGRCSEALAFHFLAALAYSLGPVFLFLFARRVSKRLAPAFWAALLWSLISPSVLFPKILADMGTPWGSHRLKNIVYWGETPHQVALALLPLALWLLARHIEEPRARRFACAVPAFAAVMLTNAFGVVIAGVSCLLLFLSLDKRSWKIGVAIAAILSASYLLICRLLPPSVILLIRENSATVGGDFRPTTKGRVFEAVFLLVLGGLALYTRRIRNPMLRFAVLFFAFFGSIVFAGYWDIGFIPLPLRYLPEMEVGLCLLAVFALDSMGWRIPRAATAALAIAGGFLFVQNYRFARNLIQPLDIEHSVVYRQARWIAAHLPGQRVMVSGENQFWFNLFAANPQMAIGHEATDPNWVQRVAVYTIYTGENAGSDDAAFSVLWLKTFGCAAVTVPGPNSADQYHPIRNPRKFDGVLPLIWRENDDSVYRVPLKSTGLAHVIPASAVVARRPVHGLDVEPLRPYVAALEDPALPNASLAWENPQRGRITARVAPGQVISVQMTYDHGWRAATAGRLARIRPDGLGMTIIEPDCTGDCAIDLEFARGTERTICLAAGTFTAGALLAMLFWPLRRRRDAGQDVSSR